MWLLTCRITHIVYRSFEYVKLNENGSQSDYTTGMPMLKKMKKPHQRKCSLFLWLPGRWNLRSLHYFRYAGLLELIDSLNECKCEMTKLSYRLVKQSTDNHNTSLNTIDFSSENESAGSISSNYTLLEAGNRTWEETETLCKERNAHLSGIHNFAKLNSIRDFLKFVNWKHNIYIYIG